MAIRPDELPMPAVSRRPLAATPANVSILCIGELTTRTDAADVLDVVITLAEAAPWTTFALVWAGEGSLRGVLAAQPLPATVSQRFLGSPGTAALHRLAAECDVICLLSDDADAIAAAQASKACIIARADGQAMRRLQAQGQDCQGFAARQPDSILQALALAVTQAGVAAVPADHDEARMEPA